ncbi:SRPBCC family protein [Jiangella alba]|nr:SRPBCC family protein [Jiangella alba]
MSNDRMKVMVWQADGRGSIVTVAHGPRGPEVTEEPASDPHVPGTAGIAVLDDAAGRLGSVTAPLGALFYAGPSTDVLFTEHVSRGRVDDRAPTQAAGRIVVDAQPLRVWRLLADVEQWPRIRADVGDVDGDGPATPGGRFGWSSGANRFHSRFGAVEPGRLLTWVTSAPGTRVAHVYRLEPEPGGRTRVSCQESLAGPLVAAVITSAVLQAGVDSWLAGLKALAEAA